VCGCFMRVSILASGSKGNASLYESGGTRLLVDAGIGVRALLAHAPRIDGIVVTHAHSDHVGNCQRLARKLNAPLYLSEATARAISPGAPTVTFSPREPFQVGTITVSPLPLPHDAAQVGLVMADGNTRVGLVTDLGEVPPGLVSHLAGCDVLLLESNHDVDLLEEGPYPEHLKRRIRSARGHLSNLQTRGLLRALYRDAGADGGAHTVVLVHLSEKNNTPALAHASAADALLGLPVRLVCASQREPLLLDAARPPPLPPGAPVAGTPRPQPPAAPASPGPRQLRLAF
jgi:phosphoribosyl 1,2-cyclic phosphodiesterase